MRSLLLALFWSTVGLCAVAVHLGRSAPAMEGTRAPRRWPSPPPLGVNFCAYPDARTSPFILDAETGAIVPCTLPDGGVSTCWASHPGRDAEGQSHLIAHRRGTSRGRNASADELFGMERYTFPAGRLLERVLLDVPPIGPVCWSPDRSDRILFAGGDSRLYLHDFATGMRTNRFAPAPTPRPLQWQGTPPGGGPVLIHDPCWPAVPGLGGRLLASMTLYEDDAWGSRGPQLWWLELDSGNATIVAAGRVIVSDEAGSISAQEEERRPCVGTARDGTLMLAYLARTPDRSSWDLWVAPIRLVGPGHAPRVLLSTRRKLAEGCAPLALAFSTDGRSVYVSKLDKRSTGSWGTLRCCPVDEGS